MAGCRIVKVSVDNSIKNLNKYAESYETEGQKFVANFKKAIEPMEGDAKEALLEFFETNVEGFVTADLPEAIRGLASLLAANGNNFDDVDAQLASSIRGNQ